MLINRIEHSVDIMLEGLDACDPSLMLEAAKEFDEGVKTAAKIAQEFVKILEKANAESGRSDNAAMPKLIDGVKKLAKDLSKVDTSDAPSKFSFKANLEMRDGDGDDAVAKVTQAAASLDVLYNGTKDAIIGIAQILDPDFKEVFSVGSNGIVIAQEFAKDATVEQNLTIMDVARGRPEDTVMILSGDYTPDKWKEIFAPLIKKGMQDPNNDAELQGAQDNFLKVFQTIKDKLEAGMKSIVSDLQNIEPNEDLKQATQETGFLRSLLKSKNPYQMDASMAQGIIESVSMLTLNGLTILTQGLVGMTKEFEGGIGAAILGVKKQAETQSEDKIPKLSTNLIDELVKLNGVNKEMAGKILALGEIAGYIPDKHKDFSQCKEQAKLSKEITTLVSDGDVDGVIDLLNLAVAGQDEKDDPNEVEQIADEIERQVKDDPDLDSGDAVKLAIDQWEEQLSDRQKQRINAKPKGGKEGRLPQLKRMVGEVTPPEVEAPTDPQKVAIAADDWGEQHKIKDPKSPIGNPKNFSPKQLNKLIDVLPQIVQDVEEDEEDSEESDSTINDSLYRRWSKLAGIIKG